jgi:hypothetical protein
MRWYRENFRIYPLADGPDPDAAYVPFSQHPLDCTHARDVRYFERLAEIVQYEPSGAFTPYELGLLKAIGIERGRPFEPDERMRALLAEGIEIGDAIAKANAYASRLDGVRAYPDRKFEYLFVGGRHDFMSGDALWLDARLLFHYEAIVVTPAMAMEMVGAGSQYLTCYRDATATSSWGNTPTAAPATGHPGCRLLVGDRLPPRDAVAPGERRGQAGSQQLRGPALERRRLDRPLLRPLPPDGYEQNWIRTLPDQGWSIFIRLYGPLEPYFDQTWKPDDIVRTRRSRSAGRR